MIFPNECQARALLERRVVKAEYRVDRLEQALRELLSVIHVGPPHYLACSSETNARVVTAARAALEDCS